MSADYSVYVDQVVLDVGGDRHRELVDPGRLNMIFLLRGEPSRLWVEQFTTELRANLPSVHPEGHYIKLLFAGEEPRGDQTYPPVARFSRHTDPDSGEDRGSVFLIDDVPVDDDSREKVARSLAKVVTDSFAAANDDHAALVQQNRAYARHAESELERIESSLNRGLGHA